MKKVVKGDKNMKNRVFNLLERIEEKTGTMAHEITELAPRLKDWQDGLVKDSYFVLTLTNYLDGLVK